MLQDAVMFDNIPSLSEAVCITIRIHVRGTKRLIDRDHERERKQKKTKREQKRSEQKECHIPLTSPSTLQYLHRL